MRYIESIFAAGRTLGKRANPNSSLLDSIYCGSLIIKLYVLMYCGVSTLKSNRPATRIVVIPGIIGVKFLMRPRPRSSYAVNKPVRTPRY